ncbi:MAG: outer membrane protein assembly factor BamA [Deltaproteobacteria bacterium]|nr:outer membrane protein assembly factor BamA [Deltaproteobacteria bacterium]
MTLDFPAGVKTGGIQQLIETRQGMSFDIDEADDTLRRIYSTNQCSNVGLDITAAGGKLLLTYTCDPIVSVSGIEFHGANSLPVGALERAVSIQEGTPFYVSLLNVIKGRVIRFYNNDGYMKVGVKTSFTRTSYTAGRVIVSIEEGKPVLIKSIRFTGSPALGSTVLADKISIAPGQRLVKSGLDGVIDSLDAYYHSLGYWQAYIEKPAVTYTDDLEGASIDIRIDAGPLYSFEFKGARHISDAGLLDVIGINKGGGYLNFEIYRMRLEEYFKDRGYYFCTVSYSVVREKRIHVLFDINEGKKIYVAGIFFSGNAHIGTSELKAQMLTRPWRIYAYIYDYAYNGVLSPKRFENDIKAIIYLYKIHGFLNVKVREVKIDFADPRKEWINVTIVIDEGARTTVDDVRVDGVSEGMSGQVMGIVGRIRLNGPFNLWQVQDVKREIEQFYFSHGYINAEVSYDYTIQKDRADVSFSIQEGARIYIGKVIIAGNTKTATWVIEKNLDFRTGMYFVPDNIIHSRINLLKTGYFDSVDIKPMPDSRLKNTVDIDVIVKERKTMGISGSVGYGTVEGYRGAVDLYDNNILGTARSLNFHVGGAVQPAVYAFKKMFNVHNYLTTERDLELGYRENYLLNTGVTGSIDLIDSYVKNFWIGYGLRTESVVVGLNRNIGSVWKLSLQYDFEIREPMDVQPGAVLGPADVEQRQLGIVSPVVFFDERNDPFNPTNGFLQVLRVDWAKHWFISQEEYLKLYYAATKYVPVTSWATYVLSLRGGYAWPLGTTVDLPIEKRFDLGGGTTVRGFAEDSVGPMVARNVPIGGDIMLNYQTEFRLKLIDSFDGVIFTDGGNIWPSPAAFELKGMHDIRKTAGVGIRYVTPAGALNLDVGFKLDRRPGEDPTAWNFYIGTVL